MKPTRVRYGVVGFALTLAMMAYIQRVAISQAAGPISTELHLDKAQMGAIFPEPILEQEMSAQRWIEIPDEVRQIYALWRPAPLCRALRLEQALGTPAKIFYKYEGVSPAGSHKPNSAVPQAYFNKIAGTQRLTTETGAGQWGSSIAFAGQMFGLPVRVYMVKVSYEQKPFRRSMMQTWGAEVFASPTQMTNAGRAALAVDPNCQGSLGLAISEAVEEAASEEGTCYTLGSVLNHVIQHQSIVGLEAKKQFEKVGLYPDVIFGPCGGGSSFGGIAFPFLADKAAHQITGRARRKRQDHANRFGRIGLCHGIRAENGTGQGHCRSSSQVRLRALRPRRALEVEAHVALLAQQGLAGPAPRKGRRQEGLVPGRGWDGTRFGHGGGSQKQQDGRGKQQTHETSRRDGDGEPPGQDQHQRDAGPAALNPGFTRPFSSTTADGLDTENTAITR